MKKKLLISLLPVLMALSACGGARPAEAPKGNPYFEEDALAHDEDFSKGESTYISKSFRNLTPVDPSEPLISIQRSDEYDVEGKSGKFVSVRFVAAVPKGQEASSMVWTRAMFDNEGTNVVVSDTYTSTHPYTLIHDGEGTLDISDFQGGAYGCFITYTLRKISVSYNNYFLKASLSIGGVAATKSVGTSVDLSKQVSFPINQEGYFLKGNIDGDSNALVAQTSLARFEDVNMDAGDTFYVCYNHTDATPANSEFGIFGKSNLPWNPYFEDDSTSSKIKCTTTHSYSFTSSAENPVGSTEGGHTLTYTNNSSETVTVPLVYYNYADNNYQFADTISPKTNTQVIIKYDGTPLTVTKDGDTANFHNDDLYVVNGAADLSYWFKWYRNGETNSYSLWLAYPEGPSAISATVDGSPISLTNIKTGGDNVAEYSINLTKGQRIVFYRGYDVALEFPNCGSSTSYVALQTGAHTFYVNSSYKLYVDGPTLTGTQTIYVVDVLGWGTMYAHYWKDDVGGTTWPGDNLGDPVGTYDGKNVYSVSIDLANRNKVIFHNNNGTQTWDITLTGATTNAYYLKDNGESKMGWDLVTYVVPVPPAA